MDYSLAGRVALVPGGSGGIGSAVAEALGQAGASVAIGYHHNRDRAAEVAERIKSFGAPVALAKVDAGNLNSVQDWVAQIAAELGPIDILAHCVGSSGGFKPFLEQSVSEWPELVRQHFISGINFCQSVLPSMIERKSGRIIFLTSDGARVGQSGAAVANGACAGLVGFGKGLAREVARDNVTVNCVSPGPTRTGTFERGISSGTVEAKFAEGAARLIPMKRIGEPHEVADAFVFLASNRASFITGQTISVSGGLTMI